MVLLLPPVTLPHCRECVYIHSHIYVYVNTVCIWKCVCLFTSLVIANTSIFISDSQENKNRYNWIKVISIYYTYDYIHIDTYIHIYIHRYQQEYLICFMIKFIVKELVIFVHYVKRKRTCFQILHHLTT